LTHVILYANFFLSFAIFTRRATAGIAITLQAILRFFAPQGRHDSRFSVKFGTVPNFTVIREYLGVSGSKNLEKLPNFQLFRPAGANPFPDVDEICRVYASNQSTKDINIWCNSVSKLGIYRQNTTMGHSPPKFRSPLAPKLLDGLKKIKRDAKSGTDILYLHAKFDGDPPLHGGVRISRRRAAADHGEKQKLGIFVFVCLSGSGSCTKV